MAPHLGCWGMTFLLTLTINHERTVTVQTWTDKRTSELWLVLNNPVRVNSNFVTHVADVSTTIDLLFDDVDHRNMLIVSGSQKCDGIFVMIAQLKCFGGRFSHGFQFHVIKTFKITFSLLTFLLSKSTCFHALRVESISNWKNMQNEQQDTEQTRNFEPTHTYLVENTSTTSICSPTGSAVGWIKIDRRNTYLLL